MIATIFLSVLILALLLGNAFLSLTAPKRPKPMAKQNEIYCPETGLEGQYAQEELPAIQETVQQKYSFQETETIQDNGSRALVARQEYGNIAPTVESSFEEASQNEKVEYLGRRITRLEQLLLKLNGNGLIAQKINETDFNKKLDSLSEFKQNTKLEIAALKQRLDKIQPVEKKEKKNVPDISDEKLRDIVFRASN